MFRRRPLLRAAVVGGGAYVAGKHVARKQQYQAEQDARISDLEQQQPAQPEQYAQPAPPAPAPAPPAQPAAPSMLDQLNQLAALHQQGVLSDDEFTAAKAKILNP
jgi:hypothetical protein